MHHNTHERRPGDFNGKDRGCSRGAGVVTTAGQLSRNTGKWTQKPLVRLFEPQRACPVLTSHRTAQECLGGRDKKGTDGINGNESCPRYTPYSTLWPCQGHTAFGAPGKGGGGGLWKNTHDQQTCIHFKLKSCALQLLQCTLRLTIPTTFDALPNATCYSIQCSRSAAPDTARNSAV